MKKKKIGVSNTPYDGGRWVTDGGWWVTDGGWWVTDGGWWVTDGGWWVATKHQRVDAIVGKKKGERPYGTPWAPLCMAGTGGWRCLPHATVAIAETTGHPAARQRTCVGGWQRGVASPRFRGAMGGCAAVLQPLQATMVF